jgi:hypothetical protein
MQWRVRYVAGSKNSETGAKLDLAILNQEVTGKKGKNIVLQIPAASITEVGYDTSSHNRGWAGAWLDAGSTASQGSTDEALIMVPFVVGAAVTAPLKSTQHFVRILWREDGVPSEVLFEVGKDDYSAILEALQNLTGKRWQDLPGARKKLLAEIQSAKNRSVPLQVDRTVVLNKAEMKSGNYQLILLERPDHRGGTYFFAGQDVNPKHVTAQAVVTIEPQAGSLDVAYAKQMGVETIATIQLPDKKLVFDSSGPPARIAWSNRSFYGGSKWATVVVADYMGEPALRFHVVHNPLPSVCHEYVFVTRTRVASEIAPNSPQSDCATFSAPRAEVKAVALEGKRTDHSLEVTVGHKIYNLQPLFEGGSGGGKIAGFGKISDAARDWAAFFVQTVTDFNLVEREPQTLPNP